MATISLNGASFTVGATNGAAADFTAASALCDQIDAIVAGWQAAYASNAGSFRAQGNAPVAGPPAANGAIGGLLNRLRATEDALKLMYRG